MLKQCENILQNSCNVIKEYLLYICHFLVLSKIQIFEKKKENSSKLAIKRRL